MSKTVLLADDSVTIRKVVELTFMEEDFDLVSLGSGEEAVDQMAGIAPDLVIADVHMPGVSGYEVCRKAKELRPERPVLLLVGTFEPFDASELEASGAETHLKKPFDSQELLQTVRDLLADAPPAADDADDAGDESEAPPDEVLAAAVADGEPVVEAPEVVEAETSATSAQEAVDVESTPIEAEEAPAEMPAVASDGEGDLSDETIDRIARRVAALLGPDAVREVAWEVVPDLAEVVIKERLRELERQVE